MVEPRGCSWWRSPSALVECGLDVAALPQAALDARLDSFATAEVPEPESLNDFLSPGGGSS